MGLEVRNETKKIITWESKGVAFELIAIDGLMKTLYVNIGGATSTHVFYDESIETLKEFFDHLDMEEAC